MLINKMLIKKFQVHTGVFFWGEKCQIVRAIAFFKHATILNMPGAALGPSA